MSALVARVALAAVSVCASALFAQQVPSQQTPAAQPPAAKTQAAATPAAPSAAPKPAPSRFTKPPSEPATPQEFPVHMRQNVVAGKTLPGTRVEAHLTLATLLDGKVFPEGATFTGVVVESIAKSAAGPSRLIIRLDSIRWKNTAATLKAYLTSWYYPIEIRSVEDRSDPPQISAFPDMPSRRSGGGSGSGGSSNSSVFVGRPGSAQPELTPGDFSVTSEHRVAMKNIESVRDPDSSLALTSRRSNIKLDKSTTYVFATAYLPAGK